jgi:hypothetical protein
MGNDLNRFAQRHAPAAREVSFVKPEEREIVPIDTLRRRQAADSCLAIADRVTEAGIAPRWLM